jgi:hypothetical protein
MREDPSAETKSRKEWRLSGAVFLIRRADLRTDESPYPVSDQLIDQWVSDPIARGPLVSLLSATGAPVVGQQGAELKRALQQAFRRGHIVALRRNLRIAATPDDALTGAGSGSGNTRGQSAGGAAGAGGAESRRGRDSTEKTWIECQLLDEDDNPIANRPYRLKLPDGSVREGVLGADGTVRVNGIDPGTCQISYTDLDGREWRLA